MDSDDAPRFVLSVRLMFGSLAEAQDAAARLEGLAGSTIADEYFIEEV